jgi:hypothetical protein
MLPFLKPVPRFCTPQRYDYDLGDAAYTEISQWWGQPGRCNALAQLAADLLVICRQAMVRQVVTMPEEIDQAKAMAN